MDAPLFLTLEEVVQLHAHQIQTYGGSEGLRDLGLLESAVLQPQACFGGQYLHEDLAAMAAAYLYHIVSNHPFIDGNKRTGMHTADVFLRLNGYDLDLPVDETEQLTLGIATGSVTKEQAAAFFRGLIGD